MRWQMLAVSTIFWISRKGILSEELSNLRESKRHTKLPQSELAAHAFAMAGSLRSLLRWWLDRGGKGTPRGMDELFHQMVWKGLA